LLEILIGADHAGFELKNQLKKYFQKSYNFKDIGTFSEKSVDYPDFANELCKRKIDEEIEFGVLICGSGLGMSMVANRYNNIRAALCLNEEMAKLSREHNDANILVLGSRLISCEEAIKCFNMFFKSKFEGNRHQARLDKFNDVKI
tara:strand:+ start:277 stop:714 length:438 start_codon:yes stop_codon:yes gene_type:complete